MIKGGACGGVRGADDGAVRAGEVFAVAVDRDGADIGGHEEVGETACLNLPIDSEVVPTNQSLTKSAAFEEVEVLFTPDEVAWIEPFQDFEDLWRKAVGLHVAEIGFGEKLEAKSFGMPSELPEVDWLIHRAKVVMIKSGVGVFEATLHFLFHDLLENIRRRARFGDELEETARLANLLEWIGKIAGVILHHTAREIAKVIAGIGVVSDVSDPVLAKVIATNLKDAIANGRRHPRIKAMSNDVIETRVAESSLRNVADPQIDVGDVHGFDDFAATTDRVRGEINSREVGVRQGGRHRNEIRAIAATEFQNASTFNIFGRETEKPAECRKAVGMCLRINGGGIGNLVVFRFGAAHETRKC